MTEFTTFSAKSVEEAVNKALVELAIPSDQLEYEVVEKGSAGFLGFGSKPAVIKARRKKTFLDEGEEFLQKVFKEMNMDVTIDINYNKDEQTVEISLTGEEMGVLIGKRGQTLDSLQHLVSLVINKNSEEYIRVKLDTENYRERRKETLEMLAKNIAYKVKRTRRSVALEPMNPYERRIIHSALQNDKFVFTKSEGEEPFRHVVVLLKKEAAPKKYEEKSYSKSSYNKGGYKKNYGSRSYGDKSYGDKNYGEKSDSDKYGEKDYSDSYTGGYKGVYTTSKYGGFTKYTRVAEDAETAEKAENASEE